MGPISVESFPDSECKGGGRRGPGNNPKKVQLLGLEDTCITPVYTRSSAWERGIKETMVLRMHRRATL